MDLYMMSGALSDAPPTASQVTQQSRRSSVKSTLNRFNPDVNFDRLVRGKPGVHRLTHKDRQLSVPTFRNIRSRPDKWRRKSAPSINSKLENRLGSAIDSPYPSKEQRRSTLKVVTEKIRALGTTVRRTISYSGKSEDDDKPVWTNRFDIELPDHISKDKSEIEYLRRRNREEAEAIEEIEVPVYYSDSDDGNHTVQATTSLSIQITTATALSQNNLESDDEGSSAADEDKQARISPQLLEPKSPSEGVQEIKTKEPSTKCDENENGGIFITKKEDEKYLFDLGDTCPIMEVEWALYGGKGLPDFKRTIKRTSSNISQIPIYERPFEWFRCENPPTDPSDKKAEDMPSEEKWKQHRRPSFVEMDFGGFGRPCFWELTGRVDHGLNEILEHKEECSALKSGKGKECKHQHKGWFDRDGEICRDFEYKDEDGERIQDEWYDSLELAVAAYEKEVGPVPCPA